MPNFSNQIKWKHSHDLQPHVGGPGGQCEGHLGGVQQEILLNLNMSVAHVLYPIFQAQSNGNTHTTIKPM